METKEEILNITGENNAYALRICDLVRTVVAGYYDLPITAFNSKSRKRPVVKMKQASVYFIRQALPKATLQYIGQQVGSYDHATVLHCLKTIKNLMETDRETKNEIEQIASKLQLQKDAIRLDGDIEKEYYYINLGSCTSIKLPNGKAIVLTGYSQVELDVFMKVNGLSTNSGANKVEPMQHTNTNLFILQKKKKEDEPK